MHKILIHFQDCPLREKGNAIKFINSFYMPRRQPNIGKEFVLHPEK